MMTQMLSQFVDFLGAHPALAVLFAFLVAFGEALLILGLFVPSTFVLVGLGTLIGLGKMDFLPVFAATVAGAIAGDALSFWAGVHFKDRIRALWPFSRYGALIAQGEEFVARHGGKSIFIVRFVPGMKAVVPTIAGMMGMTTMRFALVNVGSAFVWAAVHLLPAVALGRGLQVAHAANPRFVLLALLGLAVVIVAWAFLWLMRRVLLPLADRGRLRLARWLDGRGKRVGALAGVLRNHNRALEAALLASLALGSGAGFALLLAGVAFDPQIALADAAIGQFAQGLRTDWANAAMIGITMLGDMAVVLPIALLLIAALGVFRQWALAGTVAAAALAGAAFVPLFKLLIHRARPIPMYQGNDGFSFPSGHSTFATIIFGVLALFVAQALPIRARRWVYGGFTGLIALIALSRVYLLAHWPSDVLAGILFGGMVVFVVALVLHARVVQVPRGVFGALVAVVGLGIMPVHLWAGWSVATARYDAKLPVTIMDMAVWQADGWRSLPATRILLDGDPGEAMLIQSDLALTDVVTALTAAGWTPVQTTLSGELLGAIVPSRQRLSDHAPWPLTHLGRQPLATLTKAGTADLRLVLRIWGSAFEIRNADGTAPLVLGSLTADRLDPIAFGYAQLEQEALPPDRLLFERLALVQALRGLTTAPQANMAGPVLLAR